MNSPASDTPTETSGGRNALIAVGGLIWLVAFSVYFHSQGLPNNPHQFTRPEVWLHLPELLMVHLPGSEAAENDWLTLEEKLAIEQRAAHSGWRYFPQRLDLIFFGGLTLAGAFGWGSVLLRLLRINPDSHAECWAFSGGLGLSAWSLFTLACGLIGALSRMLFLAALLLGIVLAIALWWRERALQMSEEDPEPPVTLGKRSFSMSLLPIGVMIAVAPFLLAMALGSLLPSTDFDVKEYHLGGPKEFYQNGRITFLPHNVYTSFPFLTEMLSLSGMVVKADWYRGAMVGKFVLMAFAPLSAIAVFALARRLTGSSAAGWWGVLIHLSTPWIYRISIIAYTEGGLAFYLIVSLLAVVRFRDVRCEHGFRLRLGSAALVGLLAGSAAACKYPGLVLVTIPLSLTAMWLCFLRMQSIEAREPVRHAAFVALGVLLSFGPWLAKNVVETGNPVYPLCYSVFGGTDWNAELNEKWSAGHAPAVLKLKGLSRVPGDLWAQAVDVAVINDWGSPLLWGFAPIALLGVTLLRRTWGIWLYVAWVFLAWWGLTHRIDRFWVPMIPAVAVLAGIGADRVTSGLGRLMESIRCPRWTANLLLGVLVLPLLLFNLGYATSPWSGYNGYLLDQDVVIEETTTQSIAAIHDVEFVSSPRVLMVGEAAIFDALFDLKYNTVFDHSLFESWFAFRDEATGQLALRGAAEIRQTLADEGITHVFVNWSEVLRYRQTYGYTDFVTAGRFEELVDLGVLHAIEVPSHIIFWEDLDSAQQEEILKWSPQLRIADGRGFQRWALYEVVDDPDSPQ